MKSATEFTPNIKYNDPNTTNRTITVKPFSNTGTAANDNSSLVGRVVIPPFVDASGNGYISDDGTKYKVVGVSGFDGIVGGNTNLTAVVAPNIATTIGNNAFRSCSSLTLVSINVATSIGEGAFSFCTKLPLISIPDTKSIHIGMFAGCTSLTSISLYSAESIGTAVFSYCSSLNSVDFGDTPRSTVPTLSIDVFDGVPTTCKIIVPDAQYDAWTAASGWSDLVTAGYKFLKHSEWEYARRYELAAKLDKMEAIAWSDLKAKRDAGQLVPGQQYRITDYVATTNGDMESRSANHPFDIIVTADDERTLNEHARAIMHETVLDFSPDTQYAAGDFCKYEGSVYKCITAHVGEWNADNFTEESPYFYGCDLAAWDVWYCLDNDTTRFAWADATNGKGVVYRLVDEFQNDVPYDFKGILFLAYGDTDNVYRYTFDSGDASNNTDFSKSGFANLVYKNTISSYNSTGKWALNRIVFKGSNCHSNTLGSNCRYNTFGLNCSYNIFGSNCYSNTFGDGCPYNMFGLNCQYNTFGSNCGSNSFGKGCGYNTFGSSCYSNTFGSNCQYNTFGAGCGYNTFGSNCRYNTFGGDCSYNTFGTGCGYNTFGSNCYSNTFGLHCQYNTFGDGCCTGVWSNSTQRYVGTVIKYNNVLHAVQKRYRASFSSSLTYLVGETLYYDSQYWECTTEHNGAWNRAHFTEIQLVGGILSADEYVPRSYYRYVELEDGVSYVALDCTADRGNGVYYQNVTVSKGIAGTESAPKHIEDANYSQTSKTTYQPANSQVISI